MKDLLRLIGLCVAAAIFAGLSHASAIPVYSTFTFTGDCTDCTGQATGTLVLQNYTLGDPLETSNFVSFAYSSKVISFGPDSLDSTYGILEGTLPVDLPGPAIVEIENIVLSPGCEDCEELGFYSFNYDSDYWTLGVQDYGTNGIWSAAAAKTAVPEPSSLAMLAAGLAGLVAWRWRAPRALLAGKRTT
jgi:hypothetical protein